MSGRSSASLFAGLLGARGREYAALRENEERFRSLTAMSADWFWETDEAHRLSWLAGEQPLLRLFGGELAVGRRIWEVAGIETDPQALKAHINLLDAHAPFAEFEIHRRAADGAVQAHLIAGEPRFAADGAWIGYRGVGRDVTEKRLAERLLVEAEERYRRLSEASPNGILVVSHGIIEYANPAAARIFRAGAVKQLVGMRFIELIEREHVSVAEARMHYLELGPGMTEFSDRRVRGLDGSSLIAEGAAVSYLERGRLLVQCVFRDVTEARRAHAELAEREKRFRDVVEASGEYVWETDAEFRYTYLSARIEAILGYLPEQMLGRRPKDFMPPDEAHAVDDWFARHAPEAKVFRGLEHRALTKEGRVVWQSVSGVPVFDQTGMLKGYRGTGADITARRLAENRLQYLATRDALTGLPNRGLLADRARQMLARAARRQSSVALFVLDLERFSAVNDCYGFSAGDDLLRAVAERLMRMVREEDTLARLYGDDFALLSSGLRSSVDIEKVAGKILRSFDEPFAIGGEELRIGANLGVALAPEHAADFQQLLRSADIALQHARVAGRGHFRVFSREPDAQVVPLFGAGRGN